VRKEGEGNMVTVVNRRRQPVGLNQSALPFVEELLRRVDRPGLSFHMPGHKQRPLMHPHLLRLLGEAVVQADVSEAGDVDYLPAPAGTLRRAQRLAAAAVGADRTFFLVNGSTVGNHAAILSTVRDGQRVLLPRNSHRSVFGALALAGGEPVYVVPQVHPLVSEPLAIDADQIAAACASVSGLAAILITSPDYFGCCPDLSACVQTAQRSGVPLLVDEAHGAHFSYHDGLPMSGVAAGADLVVQCVHKTAGSLSQSAMLHWNKGRVRLDAVQRALALLQSSSPSALLSASLDGTRALMATQGEALWSRAISLAQEARTAIRGIPGLWCFGADLLGGGVAAFDPTKLIISTTGVGFTGYEAARWLRRHFKVEVEFATHPLLVCTITFADSEPQIEHLVHALRSLAGAGEPSSDRRPLAGSMSPPWPGLPAVALNLREAHFAPTRRVAFRAATNRVCAESVIPYPPGIPVLLPGEIIDSSIVDYLQELIAQGAMIVGPDDPSLKRILVVA
jgi:arginine decarboxylase